MEEGWDVGASRYSRGVRQWQENAKDYGGGIEQGHPRRGNSKHGREGGRRGHLDKGATGENRGNVEENGRSIYSNEGSKDGKGNFQRGGGHLRVCRPWRRGLFQARKETDKGQ